MKLLLSSYILPSFPLKETFLLAQEAGLDGIELVITPRHIVLGARRIARLAKKYGVPILSIHQPKWHWPHTSKSMLKRLIRFAQEAGAGNIVVHFSVLRFHKKSSIFPFIKTLERQSGLTIALENSKKGSLERPPAWAWHDSQIAEIVEQYGLNLTFDVPKFVACGQQPGIFFERRQGHIRDIHIHGSYKGMIHRPLAESDVDYLSFLKKAQGRGYKGFLVLEVFPLKTSIESRRGEEIRQTVWGDITLVRKALGRPMV